MCGHHFLSNNLQHTLSQHLDFISFWNYLINFVVASIHLLALPVSLKWNFIVIRLLSSTVRVLPRRMVVMKSRVVFD